MNILQVIYSLSQGGAERFVVNLSNELTEKGHKVTLCTFRDDETDPAMSFNLQFLNEKVHYVNLKISSGLSIKKINRIENLVKNTRPDIIHCHLNVIPYFYRLAVTNRKIKIFHTLHSLAEKTYGNKLQFYINKFFNQTCYDFQRMPTFVRKTLQTTGSSQHKQRLPGNTPFPLVFQN